MNLKKNVNGVENIFARTYLLKNRSLATKSTKQYPS